MTYLERVFLKIDHSYNKFKHLEWLQFYIFMLHKYKTKIEILIEFVQIIFLWRYRKKIKSYIRLTICIIYSLSNIASTTLCCVRCLQIF